MQLLRHVRLPNWTGCPRGVLLLSPGSAERHPFRDRKGSAERHPFWDRTVIMALVLLGRHQTHDHELSGRAGSWIGAGRGWIRLAGAGWGWPGLNLPGLLDGLLT